MQIETTTEIAASSSKVWAVLTDFEHAHEWNPLIREISGELRPGGQLSVRIAPSGEAGKTFKPTLLIVEPNRELRWRGRFILPGLFDGEHYFIIEPLDAGRVRFIHGEHFSGLLVGPLRSLVEATEQGFRDMNAALKRRAENS